MGQKLRLKDYTDAKGQAAMKDEELTKAIKEGVKDKDGRTVMKPTEGVSDDEVNGLVALIRGFEKKRFISRGEGEGRTVVRPRLLVSRFNLQRCAMAGGLSHQSFVDAGATVNRFEANGADPDVRFASQRKLVPITRAGAVAELFTAEDTRHTAKFVVEKENVKSGASACLESRDWAQGWRLYRVVPR